MIKDIIKTLVSAISPLALVAAITLLLGTSGCIEVEWPGPGQYDFYEDTLVVEWSSGAEGDSSVSVVDLMVTCEVTMEDPSGSRYDTMIQADVVIVDGWWAYVYVPGLDPAFDAECRGTVTYYGSPSVELFDDDVPAAGYVVKATYEDYIVPADKVRERSGKLKVDML